MGRIAMLCRARAENVPWACLIAEALVRAGHDVTFFSLANPRELWEPGRPEVTYRQLALPQHLALPLHAGSLEREVRWGRMFLRATSGQGFDLWYAHDSMPVPWVRHAAQRSHRPWIFHSHDVFPLREASGLAKPFALYERRYARTAALVICPERNRARLLQAEDRLPEEPLVLRNTPAIKEPVEFVYLREWLRSRGSGDGRIFLYQGGIAATATFRELVRSVTMWDPHDDLVLLGWAGERDLALLRAEALAVGAERRVHFHPPLAHSQMWPVLCSADVGIVICDGGGINSRFCAPNKLGDYVMAGLPILYTPCTGAVEIAEGQEIGLCVEELTAAGFANRAMSISREMATAKVRQHVRAFAVSHFNHQLESRNAVGRINDLLR